VSLSLPANNFTNCGDCILLNQNCDSMGQNCTGTYIASSGSYSYSSLIYNMSTGNNVSGTGSNIHFIEWDINTDMAVANGRCADLASMNFTNPW
jgi:hypothetical protein